MKNFDQRGNVSIEFIAIITFLIIPVCFLAVAVLKVSETYLTLTSAARTGARVFVVQASDSIAKARTLQVVDGQLEIGHLQATQFSTAITCSETPCLKPNSYVTVTLNGSHYVSLPLIKPIQIRLKASQTMAVDSLR